MKINYLVDKDKILPKVKPKVWPIRVLIHQLNLKKKKGFTHTNVGVSIDKILNFLSEQRDRFKTHAIKVTVGRPFSYGFTHKKYKIGLTLETMFSMVAEKKRLGLPID